MWNHPISHKGERRVLLGGVDVVWVAVRTFVARTETRLAWPVAPQPGHRRTGMSDSAASARVNNRFGPIGCVFSEGCAPKSAAWALTRARRRGYEAGERDSAPGYDRVRPRS